MTADSIPAITRPKSSLMDRLSAAEKPTSDQSNGMRTENQGIRFNENNKMPNVKIVVGHGTPKVGVPG